MIAFNLQKLLQVCLIDDLIDMDKTYEVLKYIITTNPSQLLAFKKLLINNIQSRSLKITTAIKLSNEQIKEIEKRFPNYYYEFIENKSIIGGMIINLNNFVLDDSLSAKINKLQ